MVFNKESDFENALITLLFDKGGDNVGKGIVVVMGHDLVQRGRRG